jgi:hypothetical protein
MAPMDRKIACDAMLGSLATWLRLLGRDTTYAANIDDDALLDHAQREGRVVLTRDRELARRARDAIVVRSTAVATQIQEVRGPLDLRLELDPATARCSMCNGQLERAPDTAVAPSGKPAHQCTGCGRLYWSGTHVDRIRARLAQWREATAVAGQGECS